MAARLQGSDARSLPSRAICSVLCGLARKPRATRQGPRAAKGAHVRSSPPGHMHIHAHTHTHTHTHTHMRILAFVHPRISRTASNVGCRSPPTCSTTTTGARMRRRASERIACHAYSSFALPPSHLPLPLPSSRPRSPRLRAPAISRAARSPDPALPPSLPPSCTVGVASTRTHKIAALGALRVWRAYKSLAPCWLLRVTARFFELSESNFPIRREFLPK